MGRTPTETVAERISAELRLRQISQRQMARVLHWSSSTTQRRLSGQYPFTLDELYQVADYLGIPLTALLPK